MTSRGGLEAWQRPNVPPRCAADEQEWQEMAQEHLFAREEQSICSAPHAVVSQVPRNLFYISDYFSPRRVQVCRCPTLASAPASHDAGLVPAC